MGLKKLRSDKEDTTEQTSRSNKLSRADECHAAGSPRHQEHLGVGRCWGQRPSKLKPGGDLTSCELQGSGLGKEGRTF